MTPNMSLNGSLRQYKVYPDEGSGGKEYSLPVLISGDPDASRAVSLVPRALVRKADHAVTFRSFSSEACMTGWEASRMLINWAIWPTSLTGCCKSPFPIPDTTGLSCAVRLAQRPAPLEFGSPWVCNRKFETRRTGARRLREDPAAPR